MTLPSGAPSRDASHDSQSKVFYEWATTLTGTAGPDTFSVAGDDFNINTLAGNDTVTTGTGNDFIQAGAGRTPSTPAQATTPLSAASIPRMAQTTSSPPRVMT